MEQFKNILLGFLIAIVVCLAYQNYNLKQSASVNTVNAVDKQQEMFNNFLNLVKELKKIEQENK